MLGSRVSCSLGLPAARADAPTCDGAALLPTSLFVHLSVVLRARRTGSFRASDALNSQCGVPRPVRWSWALGLALPHGWQGACGLGCCCPGTLSTSLACGVELGWACGVLTSRPNPWPIVLISGLQFISFFSQRFDFDILETVNDRSCLIRLATCLLAC